LGVLKGEAPAYDRRPGLRHVRAAQPSQEAGKTFKRDNRFTEKLLFLITL
jgi:hypothetical protein